MAACTAASRSAVAWARTSTIAIASASRTASSTGGAGSGDDAAANRRRASSAPASAAATPTATTITTTVTISMPTIMSRGCDIGRGPPLSWDDADSDGRGHHEAAVVERAQPVLLVVDPEVAVEHAAAVAPAQRLGIGDAMDDLRDAALEHPVLGPGAGEVLDAPDFDRPHSADRHPPHAMTMGVPRRVADRVRTAGAEVVELGARCGVDPEVLLTAALEAEAGARWPLLVVTEQQRPPPRGGTV